MHEYLGDLLLKMVVRESFHYMFYLGKFLWYFEYVIFCMCKLLVILGDLFCGIFDMSLFSY